MSRNLGRMISVLTPWPRRNGSELTGRDMLETEEEIAQGEAKGTEKRRVSWTSIVKQDTNWERKCICHYSGDGEHEIEAKILRESQ